ncbi:hypothetical protein BGX26_012897 [Mortierella sp. AD094]|nr:hypothetical protein BGX26_012897 [Mortierella sp. AD094]
MPVAIPRGDRVAQWDPRQPLDSFTSPCPLYCGYLLKLGSNDRWQSRLFTFDGAVLTCVGKKSRTPPIPTYDPHVSSPFVSPIRHPYTPNTKWFLNLTSITNIRLLSSSRTYRCFPYNDVSRSLLIQTTDGRTLTLRAKKDLELERWYFILSKLWHHQQQQLQQHQQQQHQQQQHHQQLQPQQPQHQMSLQVAECPEKDLDVEQHEPQRFHVSHSHIHPPNRIQRDLIPAASLLPAHQQSAHLFNKYLQRQHYHQDPEEYQPVQPRSPQQQQRPVHPLQHLQPAPESREGFLPNEIPHLTVSAFLPQSLDWAQKRPEDDDDDEEDEDEGTGEGEDEDDDEEDIHVFLKTADQDTALFPSQPTGWPITGILEPAKAAAIDMWRRSLLTPLMRRMPRSIYSDESESLVQTQLARVKVMLSPRRPSGTRSLDLARVCLQAGGNEEQTNVRVPNQRYQGHSNWIPSKDPYVRPRLARESASVNDDPRRDDHKQHKSSQDDDNLPLAMVRPRKGFPVCKEIANTRHGDQKSFNLAQQQQQQQNQLHSDTGNDTEDTLPEPESPQVSRFSRWQKTQLSSEDESGTNRDSFAALTTPDLSRNSFSKFPSRDSYLNLANRDRNSYLNITSNSINPLDPAPSRPIPPPPTPSRSSLLQSGKKRILASILKRPSLPGLDTVVLAAAVGGCVEHLPAETLNRSSSSFNFNRLSSFTDPSLSLHGSSYSYLPIHDPDFVFSKQADASAVTPTTPTTETKAASLLPPPPLRPPRRRPITARWSKNASSSHPTSSDPASTSPRITDRGEVSSKSAPDLLIASSRWASQGRQFQEESKDQVNVPPVVPRRNSAPATAFLNVGLGIDLSQKRQAPLADHSIELSLSESTVMLPISAGTSTLSLLAGVAQSPCAMNVQDRNSQATEGIVQKQEQELSQIVVGTVSSVNGAHSAVEEEDGNGGDDDETESVLSDESFCYF